MSDASNTILGAPDIPVDINVIAADESKLVLETVENANSYIHKASTSATYVETTVCA
jgi:hypothetical protein